MPTMDLSTNYMGLQLSNPLVASASPLSREIADIRRLEDAGASAVVLWSLFEEQLEHDATELDYYLEYGAERFAESTSYFPHVSEYKLGPDQYLEHIALAKEAVDIPIIASLNGISTGGWISCAKQIAQAGADGIELNVYYIPTDPKLTSERVENVYVSVLQAVKASVSIPVAMKLSPYFSATAGVLTRLDEVGADALVLFNRFYQPDIDLGTLEVAPDLVLSRPADGRLPMRWIAILYGRIQASLAATSGIHSAEDVAKMILAGADVTMMASALLLNGIEHLTTVREGLAEVLDQKGYASVSEMKGVLSQQRCAEPAAFERANYMKTLSSFGGTATLE